MLWGKDGKRVKVIVKRNFEHVFPIQVDCKCIVDEYGCSYGSRADYCGSTLEVVASDIKKHPFFKYPDISGIDYGVICPVCGCFVVLDEDKIPQTVLDNAEEISVQRKR